MLCKTAGRSWRQLALAVVAVYTALVCAAAFEHHDVSCELKTPQHCVACTSTAVGSDPNGLAAPGVLLLADAGAAAAADVCAKSILLVVRSTGRSPPLVTTA
jgi:hypothetical protein